MSNDIAGNPASYASVIRAPSGGENRSSVVFDRALSDLADRTANLKSNTADSGTLAQMQALTGVTGGQQFRVTDVLSPGIYFYSVLALVVNPPWFVAATGMGAGVWIHEMVPMLFDNSTWGLHPKITNAILPYWQTVAGGSMNTASYVAFPINNTSPQSVVDHSSNALSVSGTVGQPNYNQDFNGAQGGDRFIIDISPIEVVIAASDTVRLAVTLSQAGHADQVFTRVVNNSTAGGLLVPAPFHFEFVSNAATAISLAMSVRNLGGALYSTVQSTGGSGSTTWGLGYVQWLCYEVRRQF